MRLSGDSSRIDEKVTLRSVAIAIFDRVVALDFAAELDDCRHALALGACLKRRIDSWITRGILAAGIITPWCVGIGVKVYLDQQGEATWSWLYFLHPGRLLAEIWATFWFAAPSFLLAILAHLMLAGRIGRLNRLNAYEKRFVVLASAIWGGVRSVEVFLEIFRSLDPVVFLVPFYVTALYVGHYALGLGAGFALAFASYAIRRSIGR